MTARVLSGAGILDDMDAMLAIERELWGSGLRLVAGVDEAGRGPLAGPVVAAAVLFPPSAAVPAVDDSKKLTGRRRLVLRDAILAVPGVRHAVAVFDAGEVDRLNVLRAAQAAMVECVRALGPVDFIIVDGLPVPGLPSPSRAVVGGDGLSASVAAASILAKVHRDGLMLEFDRIYPGYGFAEHKGYGTRGHLDALRRLGPCPIHRRSFDPVRRLVSPPAAGQPGLPGLGLG